ncbi:hypothetical protein BLNAU_13755 [Blattamonas nauphoetae]|uniref:Uncharacterized protein n=1 Tax=Blattamonas nauphoetae TaxID=2049346 RepID=A0ABQ9XFM8_9EUKA|nr:hypothetical protein BLNAU_13755 [Blattamonas nauphoetae]
MNQKKTDLRTYPFLPYTQRVDAPVLAKLAWDTIHRFVLNFCPDSPRGRAEDAVNALITDIVRMLPQSIELFLDSLRTASGDDAEAKKAVLVGIAAAVHAFAICGSWPTSTPFLLSLSLLLATFPSDFVHTHYISTAGLRYNQFRTFTVDDKTLHFPFLQTVPSPPTPDDIITSLAISTLDWIISPHRSVPKGDSTINWPTLDALNDRVHVSVLLCLIQHLPSTICDDGDKIRDCQDRIQAEQNVTWCFNRHTVLEHFSLVQMLTTLVIEVFRLRLKRHNDRIAKSY